MTNFNRGANLHQIIAGICHRHNDRKIQNIVYFNSKEKVVEYALDFAKTMPEQNDDALTSLAKEIRNEIHGDYYLAISSQKAWRITLAIYRLSFGCG